MWSPGNPAFTDSNAAQNFRSECTKSIGFRMNESADEARRAAAYAKRMELVAPLFFILLLLPTLAVGQSRLPPCPNDNPESSWDNCQGTKMFSSGGKYVGDFRGGKLNGQGTHTYSNGATYVGEFRDDNYNGRGTLINADGSKYVGEFMDGKPSGKGTLTSPKQDKYVGEFREGRPDGQGTLIFPNKTKFIGDFHDGKPNGGGAYYGASGSVLYKGEWSSQTWADIIRGVGDGHDDQQTIGMEKRGGVYVVPVRFNDVITLDAIVDSGASDLSIPADIVSTLIRAKTVTNEDFLGKQTYVLADGSKVPSQQFRIRSLKVGDKTLENVVASIASVNATILLGQSFLSRFKSWSVDNERHALILK
jgi:hypothetical protein